MNDVSAPSFDYESSQRGLSKQSRLIASISVCVYIVLFVGTLSFGGVHPTVQYALHCLIFSAGLALTCLTSRLALTSTSGFVLFFLFMAALAATVHTAVLTTCQTSHPVLATVSCHPSPAVAMNGILFLASAIVFFFVVVAVSSAGPALMRALILGYWLLVVVVTLIALSHWFYDTGKLFWIFAPEFVFSTRRARWPFVNSNHLGHFLIPALFVILGMIRAQVYQAKATMYAIPRFAEQPLSRIIAKPKHLYPLILIAFQFLALLAVMLSLAATLSRSTWIGLLVGFALLAVLSFFQRRYLPLSPAPPERPRPVRRHRKGPAFLTGLGRIGKQYFLLLATTLGFFLFSIFLLSGQGVELLEERVEYGFTSYKDDIRWTLYSDSFAMVESAPLFGIGLGAWPAEYPRYMSPGLADVIPEYLHSDPYQYLVEMGIVGSLPWLFLILYLSQRILRAPASGVACIAVHSIFAGLAGLLIASLLDFPFRIPAITYSVMFLLAILCVFLEPQRAEPTADTAEG